MCLQSMARNADIRRVGVTIILLLAASFCAVPALGDDLIVSGPTTISVATTYDNVIVLPTGILTANAPLTVLGDMTVQAGGVVKHSARLLSGLVLNVTGTLDLQSGGLIDLSALGLRGGKNGSVFGAYGETFNDSDVIVSGATGGSSSGAGGSYGGSGATGTNGGTTNAAYGVLEDPHHLGAGGAGAGCSSCGIGGHGGGRAMISAGTFVVNGTLQANGGVATMANGPGGGGAGGAIRINAGSLQGTGLILARGGNSVVGSIHTGGAGGGGRIAIYFDANTFPLANISARSGNVGVAAGAGTIYWKDNASPHGDVIIDNANVATSVNSPLRTDLETIRSLTLRNRGRVSVSSSHVTAFTVELPVSLTGPNLLSLESGVNMAVANASGDDVTIDGGQSLSMASGAILAADAVHIGTTGIFLMNGSFAPGTTITMSSGAVLRSTGTLTLPAQCRVEMTAAQINTVTGLVIQENAVLTGTGTVTGPAENSGTMAVGSPLGTLTISGSYLQNPTGRLAINLSSDPTPANSILAITGAASLSGLLDFQSDPTYAPPDGHAMTVLTAGSVNGTLAPLTTLPYSFDVHIDPTSVWVVVDTTINFNATVTPNVSGPDPIRCGVTKTATFAYMPGNATPALRGYEIVLRVVGPAAPINFATDFEEADGLSSVGAPTVFYVVDQGGGVYSISGSILGTTDGLQASGDLFKLNVSAISDGLVEVAPLSYLMRDPDNMDIGAEIAGFSFTADCTPPPPVAELSTAPGHQKATITWVMADASDVARYEVWRAVWHTGDGITSAYPEYDDISPLQPVWPADRAGAEVSPEWALVDSTLAGTAASFVDTFTPRGVYYYEIYAVDAVGNIGPGAGTSNRCTNYWLGDVDAPWDGLVAVPDIDELAATYGFGGTHPSYNNHCDVGPTDNHSGRGIPLTDSTVGFEDLMIVALNFGEVAPRQPAGGTTGPNLVWQRLDTVTWSLLLVEPCMGLKGMHLTAVLPEGTTYEVTTGELLTAQSCLSFVASAPGYGLDCGLALLGRGAAIVGAGELLRVELSTDVVLRPRVTARDVANSELTISLSTESTPAAPLRFAAEQNIPNPFNPSTTIAFALPESREVMLAIYALDGSLVRTLVRNELPAGHHSFVWDGLDNHNQGVATGTYFYRLVAGTDSEVRKMTLMK